MFHTSTKLSDQGNNIGQDRKDLVSDYDFYKILRGLSDEE